MSYKITPDWEHNSALINAWHSSPMIDVRPEIYFKEQFKIKLGHNNLMYPKFDIAEFESKEHYVLFMLEWS